MPRLVGVLLAVALAIAPCAAMAWAPPAQDALRVPTTDLSAQLFLQIFGENADAGFSLAAASGGRVDVYSMLRDYVLAFHMPTQAATSESAWSAVTAPGGADQAVVLARPAADAAFAGEAPLAIVAYYQPAPALSISSLAQPASPLAQAPQGSYSIYSVPAGTGGLGVSGAPSVSMAMPVRLGKLHFSELVEGSSEQPSTPALHDQSLASGTTFAVRAGRRIVNVDFTNGYERVVRTDATPPWAQDFTESSSWQLPEGPGAPSLIPAYADVSRHSIGGAVAVPVSHGLSVGLQYDTQHLLGALGAPGLSNLDAQTNTYGGSITFALPHSSSAISISAKQYRYQDNVIPSNTFTQSNANVNFTVKF